MRSARASAPGKAILFGEHAVVYGRPALAVPVTLVQATATVQDAPAGERAFTIEAPTLGRLYTLDEAAPDDPLAAAVRLVTRRAGLQRPPVAALRVDSTIPIAAGLGSGAAVATATVRALADYLGLRLSDTQVSEVVFETETLLHGTPSGIDNTVVVFGQPVYFVKGRAPLPFRVARPFQLLIADTGRPSATRLAVAAVRAGHEREPARYECLFDDIGRIVDEARAHLEAGRPAALGPLMTRNHELLRELDVSSPELERLAAAAQAAGAGGAKLSGGGRGGNLLALVTPETEAAVRQALAAAGAVSVLGTKVECSSSSNSAVR